MYVCRMDKTIIYCDDHIKRDSPFCTVNLLKYDAILQFEFKERYDMQFTSNELQNGKHTNSIFLWTKRKLHT